MITNIKIQNAGYKNFFLKQLTKNNIFLFSSPELKNRVAEEIEKIWLLPDDEDDSLLYSTDEVTPMLDTTKKNIRLHPTTIAQLTDGQRFVFTVEPAFIYTAKDWYDIWFITEKDGIISCYAFCEFIGAGHAWREGLDTIYANFVSGNYGCYEGYKTSNNKGENLLCME